MINPKSLYLLVIIFFFLCNKQKEKTKNKMRYFKYLLLLMLISCNLNKHEISELSFPFKINDFFKRSEYEVDTFIYDEKLLSFKINNFNTITLFKNSFDGSVPPNQGIFR